MQIDKFRNPPVSSAFQFLSQSKDLKVIFVEGESDDLFFSRVAENCRNIKIIGCRGRDRVNINITELSPEFPCRVYGICDRDFLHYGVGQHDGEGVFLTDNHDLLVDALMIGADITNLLAPSLNEKGRELSDLCQVALHLAAPVGAMRLYNEKKTLDISFEGFEFKRKHMNETCMPNVDTIIATILNKGQNKKHLKIKEEITQFVLDELTKGQLHFLCQGHDLSAALSAVSSRHKKKGRSKKTPLDVEDMILGAYENQSFFTSKLGQRLRLKFCES